MKTALQELIEWMREQDSKRILLTDFAIIDKATELLEKERKQIEDAYKQGVVDEYLDTIDLRTIIEAEEYYNETYKK